MLSLPKNLHTNKIYNQSYSVPFCGDFIFEKCLNLGSIWVQLQAQNSKKIQVWGTGDQMRDFIHIEDCINGVVSTMDKIDDGSPINLSTGKLTSFKEFVKIGCNILGFETEVVGTSDKPEGVFARGGDTKLQHNLGFVTKTNFKSGIEETLTFFENNK